MTTVERVKVMCKEKNIAVAKLERDLGFANGYVSQLKRGTLPDDRLNAIANYFQVSPSFLSTGTVDETSDEDLAILARVKTRIPKEMFEMVVKIASTMEDYFTTK